MFYFIQCGVPTYKVSFDEYIVGHAHIFIIEVRENSEKIYCLFILAIQLILVSVKNL